MASDLDLLCPSDQIALSAISDGSRDGRKRWFDRFGDAATVILDRAFTDAHEELDLCEFGFDADSPIAAAVEFAVNRFLGDFNLDKVRAHDRNLMLFTRATFWLAHRVGARAYPAVLSRARREPVLNSGTAIELVRDLEDDSGGKAGGASIGGPFAEDALSSTLGSTLWELTTRTCVAMSTYWIRATRPLVARGMWVSPETLTAAPTDVGEPCLDGDITPPMRARFRALAVWRFVCLLLDVVDGSEDDPDHEAGVATWFSPCPNARPYRNDVATLRRSARFRSLKARTVQATVRNGTARILSRMLERCGHGPEGTPCWRCDADQTSAEDLTVAAAVAQIRFCLGTTLMVPLGLTHSEFQELSHQLSLASRK